MERLAVFLGDQLHVQQVFLKDKTDLSCDTEVGRCYQHNFLEHRVFGELVCVFKLSIELLFLHHIEVHHIPNVQIEDPVLTVLHPKRVADIQLKSLVFFYINQLLHSSE